MAKPKAEQGSSMTKWLAIVVIAVLVIAIVVTTVLLTQQAGRLNRDLDEAEAQVTTLQGQASSLQSSVSSLQTQLAQEQSKVASLQTGLNNANSQIDALNKDVASKQSTIGSQADQIETMKYPRHFTTSVELRNWLQKDDTNTKYAGLGGAQLSFILQIRAARDGFLLPVRLPIGGTLDYINNMAVIGDEVYSVRASDDFVERWITISPALPTYPILPESGQ